MVDMDDASSLIQDLHQKLADLDHKVTVYRQDVAADFHRYSCRLLQNLPRHIVAQVDRAVVASFDDYPALRPALVPLRHSSKSPPPPPPPPPPASPDDPDILNEAQLHPADLHQPTLPSPRSTPPPSSSVIPHAPRTADLTSCDTAHDRERHRPLGRFVTPAHLPLLESFHPSPASPSPHPSPAPSPIFSSASDPDDMGKTESGNSAEQPTIPPSLAPTQTHGRPHHERRETDDTISSGASAELSDCTVRRSALRRVSSGPKTPASPRRVRFEFDGGEVLPTASPRPSEPSLVLSHTLANPRSSPPPKEDLISVGSLLGPDEDTGPPPPKVSSSQALRALSRAPLDEDTVWTVVNPEALDKDAGTIVTSDSDDFSQINHTLTWPTRKPQASRATPALEPETASKPVKPTPPVAMGRPTNDDDDDDADDDDDDDDDDDSSSDGFLAMAKPKSFANKKSILSPLSRSPTRTTTISLADTATQGKTDACDENFCSVQRHADEDENEEELFHFEGLSAPPKPRSRPAPIIEEEDENDDDEHEDGANDPSAPTLYSTSPAVSIPRAPEPLVPAHLLSGSVGSFRGRPVTMPVVKDPNIYQQAASLGDFNTFIGGLDGRSGVDDGDLNSYRASVGKSFSGTPRSLTERMMMEETQSHRRAAAQQPH